MIEQLKAFWAVFKEEEQKAQTILILFIVLLVSNWYWYNTGIQWGKRNDDQILKIDELQRTINSNNDRFIAAIANSEAKSDSCQAERIREIKARVKKDSVHFVESDRIYQKFIQILNR